MAIKGDSNVSSTRERGIFPATFEVRLSELDGLSTSSSDSIAVSLDDLTCYVRRTPRRGSTPNVVTCITITCGIFFSSVVALKWSRRSSAEMIHVIFKFTAAVAPRKKRGMKITFFRPAATMI